MSIIKKRCITFAGPPGSSKTPIAHYLSIECGLPVFSNDVIRTEVREDLLSFDRDEYSKRQEGRCKALLATGNSFIYDASTDRAWSVFADWLAEAEYEYFIISLNFSRGLLERIYKAKHYHTNDMSVYITQHDKFLSQFGNEIALHLTDDDFTNRLEICARHVEEWLSTSD